MTDGLFIGEGDGRMKLSAQTRPRAVFDPWRCADCSWRVDGVIVCDSCAQAARIPSRILLTSDHAVWVARALQRKPHQPAAPMQDA